MIGNIHIFMYIFGNLSTYTPTHVHIASTYSLEYSSNVDNVYMYIHKCGKVRTCTRARIRVACIYLMKDSESMVISTYVCTYLLGICTYTRKHTRITCTYSLDILSMISNIYMFIQIFVRNVSHVYTPTQIRIASVY